MTETKTLVSGVTLRLQTQDAAALKHTVPRRQPWRWWCSSCISTIFNYHQYHLKTQKLMKRLTVKFKNQWRPISQKYFPGHAALNDLGRQTIQANNISMTCRVDYELNATFSFLKLLWTATSKQFSSSQYDWTVRIIIYSAPTSWVWIPVNVTEPLEHSVFFIHKCLLSWLKYAALFIDIRLLCINI